MSPNATCLETRPSSCAASAQLPRPRPSPSPLRSCARRRQRARTRRTCPRPWTTRGCTRTVRGCTGRCCCPQPPHRPRAHRPRSPRRPCLACTSHPRSLRSQRCAVRGPRTCANLHELASRSPGEAGSGARADAAASGGAVGEAARPEAEAAEGRSGLLRVRRPRARARRLPSTSSEAAGGPAHEQDRSWREGDCGRCSLLASGLVPGGAQAGEA